MTHHHGLDQATAATIAGLLVLATAYLTLVLSRNRQPRAWNPWRTASFLLGIAALLAALWPPFPAGDFRGHMYQHLLIGMYAPLLLMLGAPVTLLLRSVPPRYGKMIGGALRWTPLAVLCHPVTALVLNLGGLALLYFTPFYAVTVAQPGLHHVVHLHFLAAGYLFAYAIAGVDPAPHRLLVPARLVILGVAIAAHAVLAQLLYAGVGVQVSVSLMELRGAADLMYYGGDIAELLLAFAMVSSWRPKPAGDRVGSAR